MLNWPCPFCKASHEIDETKPPIPTRNGKTRDADRVKCMKSRDDLIRELVTSHNWTRNQVATALRISRRWVDRVLF